MRHQGHCHCGAVRFEVDARLGATSAIATPSAFVLVAGEDSLTAYERGGRSATRFFCKVCGMTCFLRDHLPEVGGEYVWVNLNALDDHAPIGSKGSPRSSAEREQFQLS